MCTCDHAPLLSPSTEYHTQYYEFTGVSSCWDVIHLHRLLWASVVLNVIGLFLGIVTAAILGAYKDLVSTASKRGCHIHPSTNDMREGEEIVEQIFQ